MQSIPVNVELDLTSWPKAKQWEEKCAVIKFWGVLLLQSLFLFFFPLYGAHGSESGAYELKQRVIIFIKV